MTAGALAYEGTRENFIQLVLENSRRGLVVVDFWAPWAGPSMRQRELLLRLASQLGGRMLLVSVDVGKQKQLAEEQGVRSLPLCKLFRNARNVETLHGVQPEADYRKIVERLLAPAADSLERIALLHWQRGERDRAIEILAEGALAEPNNLELPLLLSKLLAQSDRVDDARDVLAALPPEARETEKLANFLAHLEFLLGARDAPPVAVLQAKVTAAPESLVERFQLASALLVADDYAGAMDQLVEILRRDRGFGQGKARRGMLALFAMLGADDPKLKAYRNEFFRINH